eukprot:g35328.t1
MLKSPQGIQGQTHHSTKEAADTAVRNPGAVGSQTRAYLITKAAVEAAHHVVGTMRAWRNGHEERLDLHHILHCSSFSKAPSSTKRK